MALRFSKKRFSNKFLGNPVSLVIHVKFSKLFLKKNQNPVLPGNLLITDMFSVSLNSLFTFSAFSTFPGHPESESSHLFNPNHFSLFKMVCSDQDSITSYIFSVFFMNFWRMLKILMDSILNFDGLLIICFRSQNWALICALRLELRR